MIRGIIRLAIIALIVFFAVSIWQGGDKFRLFGNRLGEKADVIKGKTDEVAKQIKKLTDGGGGEKEEPGHLEKDKKPVGKNKIATNEAAKTKEPEEDGNKPPEGLWSTLWRKIKALVKE